LFKSPYVNLDCYANILRDDTRVKSLYWAYLDAPESMHGLGFSLPDLGRKKELHSHLFNLISDLLDIVDMFVFVIENTL
jgi:hypothetical protein